MSLRFLLIRRLQGLVWKLAKALYRRWPGGAGTPQLATPRPGVAPDAVPRAHPPSVPIGQEQARSFITGLLQRGEYILTFLVTSVAADFSVHLIHAVKEALHHKLQEAQDGILATKCVHPHTAAEIILLLDVAFLRSYQHSTGAWDLDVFLAWLFRRYAETIGERQVRAAFFRMTRQQPYWELDSFIDQAGARIYV